MKKLFLAALLISLLFPLSSSAGEYIGCTLNADGTCTGSHTVIFDGLVPCGKIVHVDGNDKNVPCTFCHLLVMFNTVINFLVELGLIIAGGLFAYAGIVLITSQGNPQNVAKAKSIFTAVVIGVAIMFAAWVVVNTFFVVIGVKSDWRNWFFITCPVPVM